VYGKCSKHFIDQKVKGFTMNDSRNKTVLRPTHHNNSGNRTSSGTNKKLLLTIGIAAVLLIGLWIWKAVQINTLKDEVNNLKVNAVKTQKSLKAQAQQQFVQAQEEQLKLLAKPYVWAVRAELLRGNINQVNLFANDMIKQKNFQRVAIANNKGIIISSTNKKDEGRNFSTIGPDAALSRETTNVVNASDSILVMTSPIMGFNSRLGTLLITYAIPQFRFDNSGGN
jgi:hypothetical protein